MNKHQYSWFRYECIVEANSYYDVKLKFVYNGVIITSASKDCFPLIEVTGLKAEDVLKEVKDYLQLNFKRKYVIIKIPIVSNKKIKTVIKKKGGMYDKYAYRNGD